MKNLLFVLFLVMSTITNAQPTIDVTNSTNCDITYILYARDLNSPPGCTDYATTVNSLPASTATTSVFVISGHSWVTGPPAAQMLQVNAYVVDYDPNTLNSCIVPPGYFVGRPSCGYSNSISLASCSCSGTNTVYVDWAQTGGTTWSLNVHY